MTPKPYTEAWLQMKSEENWARVDPEKRRLCVEHLRKHLSPDDIDDLRQEFAKFETTGDDIGEPGFHFFGGMQVRNILRQVMLDDELPGVKYDHIEGSPEFQNWDDFYMAALREAVQ